MRNRTEMMQSILTSKKAQEIIDYVSPIYGESYVALWIFQAIGTALDKVYTMAEKLMDETNPASADLLLDYWERHYSIPINHDLTKEQRQLRLIAKSKSGGPCNPRKIETAISGVLGGIPVEIQENTEKNTFLIIIQGYVEDLTEVKELVDRIKPAHLIYQIRMSTKTESNTNIKIAVAVTHAEKYKVEVMQ